MNTPTSPRRLILYAGYSTGSKTIVKSDLEHVQELSRFGDVCCWYDNSEIDESSISAVKIYANKFYFGRHGEYDFGSWKYLYQKHSSEELDSYDELVLTNNSILLLDKLDRFFTERSFRDEEFFAPLMLDDNFPGPDLFIQDYEAKYDKYSCNVMYASVFWGLRHKLFQSDLFKHFINSIKKEEDRLVVCKKYERGFSRRLWRNNVTTTTLIPKVYRHSALYTEDAFLLPSLGFPFVKKKALQRTFYDIPDIVARGKALLRRAHPDYRDTLTRALREQNIMEKQK